MGIEEYENRMPDLYFSIGHMDAWAMHFSKQYQESKMKSEPPNLK